jgi:2-keto-3-deoxy-6-phosphogluconate aldolase
MCERTVVAAEAQPRSQAEELGCEVARLFPAAAFDGLAFVRGILSPSQHSRNIPTNVQPAQVAAKAWFRAGVA